MRIFIKLFLLIISFFSFFNFQVKQSFANTKKTYFIVTAYYSPLPHQKHYITWTYAWDKRLNWEGHTTASWKKSFMWMLAAPSKYPFWTKIYFKWYGVWVVEDRGWAIVKAWVKGHKYDRIDIWMWYWDEWLYRAKKWWKRILEGKIVTTDSKVSLEFSKNILSWLENIVVNPEKHPKKDVEILQKKFKELWLYSWKIDWKYSSIKNSLINFQLKEKIIKSKNSIAAWWFWPKTYKKLLEKFSSKDVLIKKNNVSYKDSSPKVKIILDSPEIRLNWDNPQIEEVKKVQELFKKLWMYSWKINWNYNSIKKIILKIQKQAWIIKNNHSWWAWYFWEKTKAALIKYFEKKYEEKNRNKKIKIKTYKIEKNKKIILSRKNKEKLKNIANKIKKYINQKAWIDNNKKKKLKNEIKNKILRIKNKTKNQILKIKLDYLLKLI